MGFPETWPIRPHLEAEEKRCSGGLEVTARMHQLPLARSMRRLGITLLLAYVNL